MENNNYIGIGINPNGPDLPLGLGMELAQNPQAMNAFGRMTNAQKASMISQIQGAATGEEAKSRIAQAIQQLSGNQVQF